MKSAQPARPSQNPTATWPHDVRRTASDGRWSMVDGLVMDARRTMNGRKATLDARGSAVSELTET